MEWTALFDCSVSWFGAEPPQFIHSIASVERRANPFGLRDSTVSQCPLSDLQGCGEVRSHSGGRCLPSELTNWEQVGDKSGQTKELATGRDTWIQWWPCGLWGQEHMEGGKTYAPNCPAWPPSSLFNQSRADLVLWRLVCVPHLCFSSS